MAGRKSRLADPDFAQSVAELYAAGKKHQDIADELEVGVDSVANYVRDPRVQSRVSKIVLARVQRVVRRVDSSIEARLANVGALDLDDLLKIRKEFVKGLDVGGEKADTTGAASELAEAMDQNPDLAQALTALANQKPAAAKE